MATKAERREGGQDEPRFFTIQALQERWGVSRTTLHREVKRKRLKPFYIGGRVRFTATEVARYESSAA